MVFAGEMVPFPGAAGRVQVAAACRNDRNDILGQQRSNTRMLNGVLVVQDIVNRSTNVW